MSTQAHRLSITQLASCDDCAVLRITGELDRGGEELFMGTLGACVDAGHRHLVLDATALSFCDSRGLNCLLAMRWLLQRRGGKLLLAGAGRRLTELLARTGSAELIPSHRTVGLALGELPESHRPVWPPATPACEA
ncbi:anti-sigma factor antagonist [Streptomyces alfalfae]|uniref:Anti-anti-sigma factor n=1 Tax=Streptomyces alfalfae TaxID=1642299 RepID=A0ABM6H1A1_9ACTN|nr:STAS domain-containing protein [Streptomyces alfalfae]AYA19928.1 anti-sigma factor antagonist [Streptomyces fradiae]APY89491.1 anti-anti-sigma factor [Streptomyces alfalfae]QUI30475.1 STAS domain-containing protein [Streptomyces alfalfae]RXX44215.1 anti-sigma factor antagonist [Streptomyces alfalfae]RZN02123.1 anti-sigma factor antagonist [Streptomyces alfalfae]